MTPKAIERPTFRVIQLLEIAYQFPELLKPKDTSAFCEEP